MTASFSHQNLDMGTSLGFLDVGREKKIIALSTPISRHIFLLHWVALLNGSVCENHSLQHHSPNSQGCLGHRDFAAWV